ncbi:MAG TPA: ATP-binding protein [Candidatus Gastranaerophilales bacterium]|nr:ATP-binding protein [Candidatus Gastranaerophilales bacterium]
MRKVFVKTQNVKNFITLINNLQNKPDGVSKMALVYGEPGLGKSRTALWLAAQNDAIYIRSTNLMTGRWFLEELTEELDEIPRYWTSDLFKQCVNKLTEKPQMIIIDEIDYLASDQKTIETIRDIHDKTNVPIIFVGMTLAQKKLQRYRHLYDRLSDIVQFKAFSINDVREIITQLCEVEITESAINLIHAQANRFRQIVRLITKIEAVAATNNIKILDENIIKEIFKNESRQSFENNKGAKHVLS